MKTMIVIFLIIVGVLVAQECIPPPTVTPPFSVDVAGAPARLIGWMEISATGDYGSEVRACDPDGDPVSIEMTVSPDGMIFDPNNNWWCWTPIVSQVGVHWVAFRATDAPPAGSIPKMDEASWVINVLPRHNNPPVLLPFLP